MKYKYEFNLNANFAASTPEHPEAAVKTNSGQQQRKNLKVF